MKKNATERVQDKLMEAIEAEAKFERDYKEAVILLSKQVPALIDAMTLLRGAINRVR